MSFPVVKELTQFEEKPDLYICAMGFEDRCLGSNKKLGEMDFRTKSSFIVRYNVYTSENEASLNIFQETIKNFSDDFSYIQYEAGKTRTEFYSQFQKAIKNLGFKPENIVVNITGMTNHALIILVDYALENSIKTSIIYTEPTTYGTQLKSPSSFTSGVEDIFTLPKFSGATLPSYVTLLIMTMGYDLTRPRGIISEIQPTEKVGVMTSPNLEVMNEHFNNIKKEHESLFGKENITVLSIFDYKKAIEFFEETRRKFVEEYNIIVALNGSKLLAVAVLLFLKKYPDIQLILSTPTKYHPDRYSKGVGRTFITEIEKSWLEQFLNNNS